MPDGSDNPLASIGAPPETTDPKVQFAYLQQVIEAFEQTHHPRIKPIKRKLAQALRELARGAERGVSPDILTKKLAGDVHALQVQTYEVLSAVVSELRLRLRAGEQRDAEAGEEEEGMSQLTDGLDLFEQGVRRMAAALKRRDRAAVQKAEEVVRKGQQMMEQSGKKLEGGVITQG